MNPVPGLPALSQHLSKQMVWVTTCSVSLLLLVAIYGLQESLDQRRDPVLSKIEDLAHLPKGEYLKPCCWATIMGADLLWLRTLQVLGKPTNTGDEYEWLYHAFDVITTLDDHYEYAFKVGGIVMVELANQPALSNRLLAKGIGAGLKHWYLPYLMAYNYYFHLGDVEHAVESARQAAQGEGNPPPWVVHMVSHMSAQAGNPEFALSFLVQMHDQTDDQRIKESLEHHIKEVMLERDIRLLEAATSRFRAREHRYPDQLGELITKGYVRELPQEPFGGRYLLEEGTGRISSSEHPHRLKMFAEPGSEAKKRAD